MHRADNNGKKTNSNTTINFLSNINININVNTHSDSNNGFFSQIAVEFLSKLLVMPFSDAGALIAISLFLSVSGC